ncbi:MAG: hypothetical protein U0892_04515 [Pirellulales bacterium]
MKHHLHVPGNWQLPEAIRKRIGSTAGRQRLMEADGQMLMILHEVPDTNETVRMGMLFWRDGEGQWRAGNGKHGETELKNLIERYASKLEEFDKLEHAAKLADEYSSVLEGLLPIVRAARNLLEVLEDARKSDRSDRTLIDPRDRAYDICRWADLLYDDTKNAMEVAVVRRAEEQARAGHHMLVSAHRLNVLAALFFPFATLGAIFGTTLTDNWSWSNTPLPFFIFLGLSAVTGLVLAAIVSRPIR